MGLWRRLRDVVAVSFVVAVLGAGGCSGDACQELADQCATCPTEGLGLIARDSCERTVEQDDALACEDRLELKTYVAFGCR